MFDEPAAMVADLQSGRPARPVDPEAFMVILLGVATMAGSPDALHAIYGIDLSSADHRDRLAVGLADILGHGLFATPDPDEEN